MKNRSLLFVPGKEKMLDKLGVLDTDIYIIDLEDSIEESQKQFALENVVNKLREIEFESIQIYVRLNKERFLVEAEALHIFGEVGFMLPKFESVEEYAQGEGYWKSHNVIALIETPKGLVEVEKIAKCDWVNALAFGAEDYTAKVNMKNDYSNLFFHKNRLVTYAKAYDKKVFDTPSFQLTDIEAFESEVRNSVELGFDGKLAINPKHLNYINEQFSAGDLELLQAIVDLYEKQEQAVVLIDGKVYEKMHITRFKRILKENGGN